MANAPSYPDLDGPHQRSLHSISRFKCGCASLLASRASYGIQNRRSQTRLHSQGPLSLSAFCAKL